jgi:hypothetical protein
MFFMNAKKVCAIVAVFGLVMPIAAMASLPAPENLTVDVNSVSGTVVLDWNDVDGAVKYSVDIEGVVTYWATTLVDGNEVVVEVNAPVEVSFGTSDRTDGGLMGDSDLTLTFEEIEAAIAAELGVDVADLISFEDATAKVKALDPGKGKGPQNNPFCEPVPLVF